MINDQDRQRLLTLARRALEARVRRTDAPDPDVEIAITTGVFVSIFRRGELRGCLGRLNSPLPVPQLIVEMAQEVADSDPRFERVAPHELPFIAVEISVLTSERQVGSVAEIEVGRHGLIIERGASRGLLLPQVATEHGWDRDTFLDHTCLKAGLPIDAWKRGALIFVFEAEVFGEREPRPGRL